MSIAALSPTSVFHPHVAGPCLLCHQRQRSMTHEIYGHPVCRTCYWEFAGRRWAAYAIDALLFAIPAGLIYWGAATLIARGGHGWLATEGMLAGVMAALLLVFAAKDGFAGRSPGKRVTGVEVRDRTAKHPIGFVRSTRRNAVLVLVAVPLQIGVFIGAVIVVVAGIQVGHGYRLGDRAGRTRVIWLRYARTAVFGGHGPFCPACNHDLHGGPTDACPKCAVATPSPTA